MKPGWWRWERRGLILIVTVLLVLVAARAAAPGLMQWYANRTLDRAANYSGRVGDVDLSLLCGAYKVEDIRIFKTEGEVPVPLFQAERLDFSVQWRALAKGSLVGEVRVLRPQLNIVDGRRPEEKQTGEEADWRAIIRDLFPLRIDTFEVEQGSIHFRNYSSDPQVDIFLRDLNARVTNFTNSRELADTLVATLQLRAVPMDQGRLSLNMRFDPYADPPEFDLNVQLADLKVSSLNDFIEAYANLDVEAGTLDLALELAADQGRIQGYIKPVIHDLTVFSWTEDVQEENEGFFRNLWEGLVGLTSEIFENQPRDTVATRVPIDGRIDDPQAGVLPSIAAILRNAFIEAIQPQVEGTVDLERLKGGDGEAESGD